MTREEAIRRLLNIERSLPNTFRTKEDVRNFEALEMAIKALEQEPSGDLISKQSVLNACEQSINILEAVDRITDLPSVEQEPSEDCIKRQAALDAMYELCNTGETLEENPWRDNPHIDAITDAINNLPPVNPQEPEIGHWIYDRTRDWDGECKYECSECGMGSDVDYAYCMRCGARMVGEQESEDKE